MKQPWAHFRPTRLAARVVMVCGAIGWAIGVAVPSRSQESTAQEVTQDLANSNAPGIDEGLPEPAPAVLAAQQQRIEAMRRASLATVGVFGVDGQGGGSGVCITPDGYVLTNFHVSSPFGHRMRCGLNDGKMYEAVVAGIDPTGDLAVLKMFGRDDFPVAAIGDSDQVRVGQWCFAAGNPFVLATNLQPTVTYGLISGVRRYQYPAGTILEYSDCIQTDAAINPGNSGGPLFNANGELIGINGRCSFEKRGRVNVGVGYAISIQQAMNFFWHLRSGRIVDHATLGFTVATDTKGRVVVSNILETSDAYRRGLRYGDEVLRLGSRDIATTNQLKNVSGIFPAQWRVPLRFRNETDTVDTMIRLQNLHLPIELEEIVQGESAEAPKAPPKSPQEEPEAEENDPNPKPKKEGESQSPSSKAKPTDVLAEMFETRRGFSNYHFNRVELDRILSLHGQHGDWGQAAGKWQLLGRVVAEPTEVSMLIDDSKISMALGDRTESVDAKLGWTAWVQQQTPLAMALGVRTFQQWHQIGPRKMGEAIYIGRSPVLGKTELQDTTRITLGEINATVFTSPETGTIACIELLTDNQTDPAEIYFDDYRTIDGRSVPTRLRLVFGLENRLSMDWGELRVNAISLPSDVASEKGNGN
jgi:serine protease Do